MARLDDISYWKSLINIGLSKILILKILSKGPSHGYGILKQLESLTHDCCTPTFGTIYPILKELTRNGYAEVREENQLKGGQKRRVYTLTPTGLNAYRIALEAWRSTIPYIHTAIENDKLVSLVSVEEIGRDVSMNKESSHNPQLAMSENMSAVEITSKEKEEGLYE